MPKNAQLNPSEVLLIGLAIVQRFRCKKIAQKPDAKSWSIEQDFLSGIETALKLDGRKLHPIIKECQENKRSITTLTIKDFNETERVF